MPLIKIGNAESNINELSTESISDLKQLRRDTIKSKLFYLKDSNTPEEFDYIVEAELRRGTTGEFGLPAKHLVQRFKSRVRKAFKKKHATPTVYEQLKLKVSCMQMVPPIMSDILKSNAKPTWENSPQALAAAYLA